MATMQIGIKQDYRAFIQGAIDMLAESAKQHRLRGDSGHAEMCEAHRTRLQVTLRAIEHGETL